jgi:cytosine/adenosine deaminase-related metal-dependent hydrolase
MRSAFAAERVLVNAAAWQADKPIPEGTLSARGVLEMATVNGAYTVGLESRTGSLTPGKQADVVVIDGKAPGTAPVIDPVAAVVLAADVSNVDTVIIAGKVHKRDGKLVANYPRARELVEKSRDFLTAEAARKKLQPVG